MRVACGYGGEAWREGVRVSCAEAMADIPQLLLTEKEALSLMNGATLTAAMAALVCAFARTLMVTAEEACALSFEVVRADTDCLNTQALSRRNHTAAVGVANRLRERLNGSEMVSGYTRPFSVRCASF